MAVVPERPSVDFLQGTFNYYVIDQAETGISLTSLNIDLNEYAGSDLKKGFRSPFL